MTDRAVAIRKYGDFSGEELALIMATLTNQDPDAVCQVAAVLVIHPPEGGHELVMATTIEDDRRALASILEHAARHVYGGCDTRRKRNAKGGNNASH